MLFDTHAHYDDEKFGDNRHETIKKAYENGVSYILNASSDMASVRQSISLAHEYDFIYAAVGIHPHHAREISDETLDELVQCASDEKVVAIGEIGLDYFYDFAPKDLQMYWFARQISLARSLRLPVIIHNRDSHEDVMRIIRTENARDVGGVFHCYSGSVEMAKVLLDHNFYISFGGPVTFKNAKKTLEVAKYVPDDRLLIETDCPYLTPEPFRGKRNDSSYVRLVAEKIAEIRNSTFEHIACMTTENGKRLFNIS